MTLEQLCKKKDEIDGMIWDKVNESLKIIDQGGVFAPVKGGKWHPHVQDVQVYGTQVDIKYSTICMGNYDTDTVSYPLDLIENPTVEKVQNYKKLLDEKNAAKDRQEKAKIEAQELDTLKRLRVKYEGIDS